MAKKTAPLLPANELRLQQFGDRVRLARLRRRLTAVQVAERAGMTPVTLRNLERGNSGVTIGAYLSVMQVLGVEQDLDLLVKDDPMGRELQDAALPRRSRKVATASRPKQKAALTNSAGAARPAGSAVAPTVDEPVAAWIAESRFVSSDDLASLLEPPAPDRAGRGK